MRRPHDWPSPGRKAFATEHWEVEALDLDDRPREACGVFGIMGVAQAAEHAVQALYALQHRGQESAGVAVRGADGAITVRKGMGLVREVFSGSLEPSLTGRAAIGHVRYSTTGSSTVENAQPLVVRSSRGTLALAHNGNLVNTEGLRRRLEQEGSIFQTTTDTEIVAHLMARSKQSSIQDALSDALRQIQGGYALVLLTEDALYGVRDPNGLRPLALGRLHGRYLLASESCAFDTIGARLVREVLPGEVVQIRDGGRKLKSHFPQPPTLRATCVFEYIYFARPDSTLGGQNVHAVRKRLGRELAREHPAAVDMVIGVPDSSTSAAAGFAEELRVPCELGLVKNRYIGRTFIDPLPEARQRGVRLKLNAIASVVGGQRVALVDDSIVRGTTSQHLIALLREAGAREVHMRISSPPFKHLCHYGIDTSARGELLADGRDVAAMTHLLGADSLGFLSPAGLLRAVGSRGHCLACFTGDYPVPIMPQEAELPALARSKGGSPSHV